LRLRAAHELEQWKIDTTCVKMALRVFALDQSQMTLLSGKIVIGEVEKNRNHSLPLYQK
jgi:hypothetical protein